MWELSVIWLAESPQKCIPYNGCCAPQLTIKQWKTCVDFRDSCFHRNSNISSVRLYTCWQSSVLISWVLGPLGTEPSSQQFNFPEKHSLSAKKCQIPPAMKDLWNFKLRKNHEELMQLSPFCPDISDASFCLNKSSFYPRVSSVLFCWQLF